jgi:hypothetical protein
VSLVGGGADCSRATRFALPRTAPLLCLLGFLVRGIPLRMGLNFCAQNNHLFFLGGFFYLLTSNITQIRVDFLNSNRKKRNLLILK